MDSEATGSSSDEICMSAQKVCSIDDLLIKILAGLPLGSLRLFKSVCKRWSSLITDPTFNALRTRSPNAHHPQGLLFQLQLASSVFVYVPLLFKLDPPPLISFPYSTNFRHMEVWQSCNGLLLCNNRPDKLYVYNPTINQCKLLPLPYVWVANRFLKALAIAFDPAVSPHYKLVYAREDLTRPGRRVHVEIYSSETCIWRPCEQTFSLASFVAFDRRVVYWHGAIHWVSRLHVYHFSLDGADFIHVEDHKALYGITYGAIDKLVVSRDRLLLVRLLQPLQQMNVYEMNNISAGWSPKYHVDLQSAPPFGPDFCVLSVVLGEREEDSFFVLEVTRSMLL